MMTTPSSFVLLRYDDIVTFAQNFHDMSMFVGDFDFGVVVKRRSELCFKVFFLLFRELCDNYFVSSFSRITQTLL